MAYQYPETRKFLGLYAQANSFDLPDGAMERCLNAVINDDNVVSKARGFYRYYAPLGRTLNNLFLYQGKLLAAFSNALSYFTDTGSSPNETGTPTDLTGATVSVTGSRVSRSLEQNGNFYATSDNGVLKIDAYNGKIFTAGTPPALDIRGNFLAQNGPIAADSAVGYRVVFGRRDANDNLLIGAPSDILTLTNALSTGIAWARSGAGPWTITVSATLHNLAVGMTISVSSGSGIPNGTYTITAVVSPDSYQFSVTADPGGSGTLSWAASRVSLVEFSIPREITSTTDAYFFQIYRSSQVSASTNPEANFRLIEERELTSSEISGGFISYQDDVDETLVQFAPELYTNPNSREGELQANFRPPLCQDLALFQNYVFYSNCTTRHVLNVDVIAPASLASGDYVEIKVDSTTRRYVARTGVGNKTTRCSFTLNSAGSLQITSYSHGLVNGDYIYISTVLGGSLSEGYYYVVSATTNTFQISLTSGGAAVAYSAVTWLYFQGVTNGTYPIFQLDNTSSSVATQLRNTAQGLVKAVNRDSSSLVYGNYTSGTVDTPGKMRFTAKGFTGAIYMRASSTTAGNTFAPVLPDSFASGTQVYSRNASQPNALYISKVGEPEAVPVVNQIVVGSKNKAILRTLPLRDSVIVLKEDGVFKVTGDSPLSFQATLLDNTVVAISASSAALLNNQVYFLANQGICVATDSAVEIVSRRLENLIEPIIGASTVATQTSAVGYESDRTYRTSTLLPSGTTAEITYLHNTINDTWTESDVLFTAGVVGPSNKLYLVSGNEILKERKYGNRLDYVGQNYTSTVLSVATDLLSAVVTVPQRVPQPGDAFLKDDVFSRIESVELVSNFDYQITFRKATNLAAADTPTLYAQIVTEVKMAPFHAGSVGRTKQFAQLQMHTRGPSVTKLSVSFTGPTFGGSEETVWDAINVSQPGGWGYEPWGLFPFGLPDGITNVATTLPAPAIRLYVPQFQQRSEFIQTYWTHKEAGEPIDLQAMTWSVRGYRERTSK